MKKFAVIGNPVEHSVSPCLHREFASSLNIHISYEKLLATPENFGQILTRFFDQGGMGVNITTPFKEQAFQFVDRCSSRAEHAQSVNTVWKEGRFYYGDTTDGVGLVQDLIKNYQQIIKGRQILILGAGGAVKSVLPEILAEAPAQIVLVNRTKDKAEVLAREYKASFNVNVGDVQFSHPVDILINGTSASLFGELPLLSQAWIKSDTFCYDMVYGTKPTVFNQWAMAQGVSQAVDGHGMLEQQAAESFFLWHGVHPKR